MLASGKLSKIGAPKNKPPRHMTLQNPKKSDTNRFNP